MLSYRLSTVNDFHWEFKLVLRYSKHHTFLTFFGEKKKQIGIYSLPPRQLEFEHNYGNVKRSKIKKKGVKRGEF